MAFSVDFVYFSKDMWNVSKFSMSSVLNHRLAENVCDSFQGLSDIIIKLDATAHVSCVKIAPEFAFFCCLLTALLHWSLSFNVELVRNIILAKRMSVLIQNCETVTHFDA